ncbi:MAG: hypothetical protein ACRCVN_04385 [Spirochaetia bacterium]
MPNFQHYYWAANCRALYHTGKNLIFWGLQMTFHLGLRLNSVTNYSLSLLFAVPVPLKKVANTNIVLCSALKIWYQVQKAFALPSTTLSTPIAHNHAFKPSLTDSTFSVWSSKGMVTVRDLYVDGKFATFYQLKEKFDLPSTHFFRYPQLRNYVCTSISNFELLTDGN